jgi:hypothetical protein
MRGFFVLGAPGVPAPIDSHIFADVVVGNHTGSANRGHWRLSDLPESQTINIPTRDKQVILWSSIKSEERKFYNLVSVLDSEEGTNYKDKLMTLRSKMDDSFIGIINNISTSTHGSLALVGNFVYYGLHDVSSGTSYILWTEDPEDLFQLQRQYPLRYLVFRFPPMPVVFLPGEILCGKWWRWTKSSSLLHAFNALEMRLNNGSTS